MLFSRKGKSGNDREHDRQVEAETIARWRTIAAEHAASSKQHSTTERFEQGEAPKKRVLSEPIELSCEVILPDTEQYQLGQFELGEAAAKPGGFALHAAGGPAEPEDAPYEGPRASWPAQKPGWEADVVDDELETRTLTQQLEVFSEIEDEQGELEEIRETAQFEAVAPVTPRQPVIPPVAPEAPSRRTTTPRGDFSVSVDEDLKRRFGTNIRSALGPGTVIDGTFRFENPVCVDGTLTGEVCSSSLLIVGEQATIEASIIVGSLIVVGTVTGDIDAEDLVEIRAGGQVTGNIETRRIVIEDGGMFNGTCRMIKD